MIVLDTNVVAEPLRLKPDEVVIDWMNAQEPQTLYLTTINLAELLSGVLGMPAGKRRVALEQNLTRQIAKLFEGRVLSFDESAAEVFATVNAAAQRKGNTMSFADCAIAAIALARGFMIATRNVRDFRYTGLKILNPWA
ncbi:MAG: type II toxin-antitoxin system VapC family toxin [Clostridia bacterium]|nr:type II toxin-antitoxin system VapC family toxin [Deltaproteobacteria bacterium]